MKLSVEGIGAWGDGFQSWPELQLLLAGRTVDHAGVVKGPKPEVIPANERRRAPLSAKLAVEVCSQAVEEAALDTATMSSVFVSGLGDMDLTDYMCRQLASENKQLSPTKFHNSVHNAPAGYWTIAIGCTAPATALAGLYHPISEGLLEAFVQCTAEGGPVLLAVYDTPSTQALDEPYPCDSTFAAALVLSKDVSSKSVATIECCLESRAETCWPDPQLPTQLQVAYNSNIAARILALLLPIANSETTSVKLPLSQESNLVVSVA